MIKLSHKAFILVVVYRRQIFQSCITTCSQILSFFSLKHTHQFFGFFLFACLFFYLLLTGSPYLHPCSFIHLTSLFHCFETMRYVKSILLNTFIINDINGLFLFALWLHFIFDRISIEFLLLRYLVTLTHYFLDDWNFRLYFLNLGQVNCWFCFCLRSLLYFLSL